MAAHLLRKTSRKAIHVLRPCRAHTLHTLTYRSMSRGGRVPYRGCQVQSHPCLNLARSDVLRWFVTRPLQIRSIPRWCCRARFSQPLPNYWSCSRGELFFAVFLFFPTELTSPYLLSPGSLCYLKTDLNGQWTCKLRRKFYTCHFLKIVLQIMRTFDLNSLVTMSYEQLWCYFDHNKASATESLDVKGAEILPKMKLTFWFLVSNLLLILLNLHCFFFLLYCSALCNKQVTKRHVWVYSKWCELTLKVKHPKLKQTRSNTV